MPSPRNDRETSPLALPVSEGQEKHDRSGTLGTLSISSNTTAPSLRIGESETLPVTDAHQDVDHTRRTQTLLIPRVQQMIKYPLGPRWNLLLMMVLRKQDLHIKNLCLPTSLVLGGVVAIPFLIPIVEDRALAPRLNMVPGLIFWFWDLIPGVLNTQSLRDHPPSLIPKRK